MSNSSWDLVWDNEDGGDVLRSHLTYTNEMLFQCLFGILAEGQKHGL